MKAFQCRMCGECCYGEGGIVLKKGELENIAVFFGIAPESFVSRFCEERHGRLYVRTGEDNYCIFYREGNGCTIHAVKPCRCSLWPFYPAITRDEENWKMAQEACPGINPRCSFSEFVRQAGPAHSSCREPRESGDHLQPPGGAAGK